ncbi:MAG: DUF3108 domain-containing protein [Hyphomicrobiaceae bacterium]
MYSKLKSCAGRLRPAAIAGLTIGAIFSTTTSAEAEPWPSKVDATYRIAFNGFDIGTFEFRADTTGSSYAMRGDAQLSALLGAFKWQGATRSSGTLTSSGPRPAGYTFDFSGIGKQGSIKLGFQHGNITSVSMQPPQPPTPDVVPVREAHLKAALDPLSAVLAISRTSSGNPCQRRIPVFDGKQRFDLVFSFLRQQAVAEARPSGQPSVALVCRVRFVPIAGHRMSEETKHMASTDGIEISLRPVPSASIYVPYQISVPTIAGTATLTSERVNIVTRSEQIALTN